jgi:uncharacterized protein YndB with AHSA1/START domain
MRSIVESIEIAAPASRIFTALTDDRALLAWWTEPGSCVSTKWKLEAVPGGAWISRWRWEDGREFAIGGTVLELDPPRLLVYDWWDERYPGMPRTTVRYELSPTANGTLVTVTHWGFGAQRPDLADYSSGWSRVLEKLCNHTSSGSSSGTAPEQ